jgi:hypothetical protein
MMSQRRPQDDLTVRCRALALQEPSIVYLDDADFQEAAPSSRTHAEHLPVLDAHQTAMRTPTSAGRFAWLLRDWALQKGGALMCVLAVIAVWGVWQNLVRRSERGKAHTSPMSTFVVAVDEQPHLPRVAPHPLHDLGTNASR